MPLAQQVVGSVFSLAGPTMSIIGITFLYVWIINRTGSVFLAIVFHALTNTLNYYLLSFLEEPGAATLVAALMPWIIVVILQRRLGKDVFP